MKKGRKIDTQKRAIKKVIENSSQGIEKRVVVKRERGITLIALVVTIIIMLILAAVTLNMALGDNGLIQMAKLTANKYEQAAINESIAMQELVNDLNNPGSVAPTTTTTPPPTTTTPSGGGGEETPEELKTAEDLTAENYGDYVNYDKALEYAKSSKNYYKFWRIFYVGDVTVKGSTERRVFLIAADYVPNTGSYIKTAQNSAGMAECQYFDSTVCTSNWNTIPEYHCNDNHNTNLNSKKEQCSFPEIFMPSGSFCGENGHYYCSDHVGDGTNGNTNSRCASSLQCTGNWNPFVNYRYADYAIGGPTIEMWVASWNEKHGNSEEKALYVNGNSNEGDGYYVGTSAGCTTTSCSVSDATGYNDTLYFPHKENQNLDLFEDASEGGTNDNADCGGYWLSSPSADTTFPMMEVHYGGSIETTGCYGMSKRCETRSLFEI